MESVTILWEHHDFDGIINPAYPYGVYKFDLLIQEETIIDKYLNKKENKELRLNLVLNEDTLPVLTYLFGKRSEFPSDCTLGLASVFLSFGTKFATISIKSLATH